MGVNDKNKRHSKDKYMKENEQLVNTLIKAGAKSINYKVKVVNLMKTRIN